MNDKNTNMIDDVEHYFRFYMFAPLPDWSVVIDGHKITPKMIQRTLKKCRKAGADSSYLAECLGVGVGAIKAFIDNEKTIPEACAEKFYRMVTENAPVPLAPPDSKPAMWEVEDPPKPSPERSPNKFKEPDFDGKRIAAAFVAERKKRGWTIEDVAKRIRGKSYSIKRAESGVLKWVTNGQSVLLRLSKLYGLDLRDFELKKRVDYPLFQYKIYHAKLKLKKKWDDVAAEAGITNHLMATYVCRQRQHAEVMYLVPEMVAILKVLGIDPDTVVLREEEKCQ